MNESKEREIRNLVIQIYASYAVILTILLSIFLLNNEKSYLQTGEYIVNKRISYYVSYYGRFLALILVIVFLYVNIDDKDITKSKGNDTSNANLQIIASIFSLIAALIVFYVIATSNEDIENVTDVENPII